MAAFAAGRDDDLAREQLAAIDGLPRPTLVYLYAGLRAGASAEDVLARADADEAPFVKSDALREFVVQGLKELR